MTHTNFRIAQKFLDSNATLLPGFFSLCKGDYSSWRLGWGSSVNSGRWSAVQCRNVYCTLLYYILLYLTVLYYTLLYFNLLFNAQYSTVSDCTLLYSTLLYCTVQYSVRTTHVHSTLHNVKC